MQTPDYNRLRDDAARRAHQLRQEAMDAFWAALVRRVLRLTHLKA